MANAVKLLVAAFESSGKSTITSKLRNALVINMDHKEYGFKVPHANIKDYQGMDVLIQTVAEKLQAYADKFGKYPETIVFDTVTQMYSNMQRYNADKYRGFDVHSTNNKETLGFNHFIENTLIPEGINVVIVAHTAYDEATARYVIPATGAFAKAGSWYSVVNDSIYIEKKANKLLVHTSGMKFPTRSTIEGFPETFPIEEYSLQDHLDKLASQKIEATEFELV